MKYKNSQKRKSKRRFFITVAVLVLTTLLASAGYAYYKRDRSTQTPTEESSQGSPERKIDLSPPSNDEKSSGDRQKEEIAKNQSGSNSPAQTSKQQVTVKITDAGQYDDIIEVRAFIPDHFQDGTCTITFKQQTQTLIKETPAYTDATTTICTNPLIKRTEFPSLGSWSVLVRYSSEDATGESETQSININ